MEKINKKLSITLIIVMVLSSFTITQNICAQSTKPSPPQFTIQFPDDDTIQLVIENQEFTNSSIVNSLVYYYKVKAHNSEGWIKYGSYYLQSASETTTINIPPHPGEMFPSPITGFLNNSTLLDFQVQAQTGYYAVTNVSGPPRFISPSPQQWHTSITFNESETSDWSNTLTIDLSTKTISNPNSTSSMPITSWLIITATATVTLIAIVIVVVIKKQKKPITENKL